MNQIIKVFLVFLLSLNLAHAGGGKSNRASTKQQTIPQQILYGNMQRKKATSKKYIQGVLKKCKYAQKHCLNFTSPRHYALAGLMASAGIIILMTHNQAQANPTQDVVYSFKKSLDFNTERVGIMPDLPHPFIIAMSEVVSFNASNTIATPNKMLKSFVHPEQIDLGPIYPSVFFFKWMKNFLK